MRTGLSLDLHYHSLGHVEDVFDAASRLAEAEGISGEDRTLLLTAALFHDSGFLVQAKDHELISCDIARETLPGFGYTEAQIERICGMIMATRIPQTPHNHLEQILADADLDYLGRDDFFTIGQGLFEELKKAGVVAEEAAWDRIQVGFLKAHRYFTATAIRLRQPLHDEHLAQLTARLSA